MQGRTDEIIALCGQNFSVLQLQVVTESFQLYLSFIVPQTDVVPGLDPGQLDGDDVGISCYERTCTCWCSIVASEARNVEEGPRARCEEHVKSKE